MSPLQFTRALGAGLCTSLFLAACGGGGGDGVSGPVATLPVAAVEAQCLPQRGGAVTTPVEIISVTMSGLYEVPPVSTAGSGTGSFTVNRTTGDLSGSITVSGLSGPASDAHIHKAFAGIIGDVIVTLNPSGTPGKFDVPPATVLVPLDLESFLAGGMYVNAHTAANLGGEVRSQIVAGGIEVVRCVATGDFEVPAVTTTASGISYTTVDIGAANTGAVVANVRTSSSFTDATAAHLHQGFAGLTGDPIVTLTQTGGAGTNLWEGGGMFDAGQLSAYLNGEVYVNVHNPANLGGHIRSQVAPTNVRVLRFGLNGGQEVPPVPTSATATGYITVNVATGAVEANARTTNLTGANLAHIHQAAVGVVGDPIVPLAQDPLVPQLWAGTVTFTVPQLTSFLTNNTYLNVHTPAYPNGEIRGQIVLP